jgi:hypothetical protein
MGWNFDYLAYLEILGFLPMGSYLGLGCASWLKGTLGGSGGEETPASELDNLTGVRATQGRSQLAQKFIES